MIIDKELCIGCETCCPYCPVGAIGLSEGTDGPKADIDEERCVECSVCLRAGVCPTDAITQPDLEWPRAVRAMFSDPLASHRGSSEQGRGTEEMKTNDVTGRFTRGWTGVMVEMGRPGVGATFRDLEIVSCALGGLGVEFEPSNPVTALMADRNTGRIKREVLGERVLSAIIEFRIEDYRVMEVLQVLESVSGKIETVFSLSIAGRLGADGSFPALSVARRAGIVPAVNTKTNIGLGRPLKADK